MDNVSTEQVVGVGFSDFWQQVHDEFPKFFGVASVELVSMGNEVFNTPLSEPFHKVARHLARMVWNSLSSFSLLALNGCGVDAMKVARGMFETSVTLGYHPDTAKAMEKMYKEDPKKWARETRPKWDAMPEA